MSVQEKEKEYNEYIREHVLNVTNAYICIKDGLLLHLMCDEDLLARNIAKHDASKYSKEEYNAYRMKFFPDNNPEELSYPKRIKDAAFEKAWKHHYTVNAHHPEYWIANDKPIPMLPYSIAEMFCDWAAMSYKFNTVPSKWYEDKMKRDPFKFHPATKLIVEKNIWLADKAVEMMHLYIRK